MRARSGAQDFEFPNGAIVQVRVSAADNYGFSVVIDREHKVELKCTVDEAAAFLEAVSNLVNVVRASK